MKDSSKDVVSNSVFGIGVLAECTGAAMSPKYSEILQHLSAFLKEDGMLFELRSNVALTRTPKIVTKL